MNYKDKTNKINASGEMPLVGKIHDAEYSQFDTLHEEALDAVSNNPAFNRTGLRAQGMTDEFTANAIKNDEKIRNELYKNDPKGFEMYKRATAEYAIQKRKAIAQYEQAQVIHGLQEENKDRRRDELVRVVETLKMGYGAAKLLQGAHLEEENGIHANELANVENLRGLLKKRVDATKAGDDVISEDAINKTVEALNKEATDEIQRNQNAQTAIDLYFGNRTKELFANFNNSIMGMFKAEYEFNKRMGRSEREAYNAASSATRADVVSALKAMIDSGNGEFVNNMVLPILKDPDAIKVFEYEKDGNGNEVTDENGNKKIVERKGEFDMSGRLFLEDGDINGIEKYILEHTREVYAAKKMKEAELEEAFKLENASIRIEADKLALKMPMDSAAMEQLRVRVDNLLKNGYEGAASTSAYLRNLVEEANNRYAKYTSDAAKLQSEQDFEMEFRAYRSISADASIMAFYAEEGYGDVKIGGEDVLLTDAIDAKNRQIVLISNGLDRGVIKGERWEKRLKALHEQRADDDYREAMNALHNAGVVIDREATAELFSAGSDNQKKRSEALGGEASYNEVFGRDKSGRLTIDNAKSLMFKWKIPTDNGNDVYASISGEQLNIVLDTLARWQARHSNPTESEARKFIEGVLNDAAKREWRTHWFSKNGYEFIGFQDVSYIAETHLRDYFDSRGSGGRKYTAGQILARDMRLLEQAMDTAKLVRQDVQNDIIRMLEKRRTQK